MIFVTKHLMIGQKIASKIGQLKAHYDTNIIKYLYLFDLTHFRLTLETRAEILTKFSFAFSKI